MAERFPYPDAKPGDPVRVSLVCDCNGDFFYGYGQDETQALANATAAFKSHNRRPKYDTTPRAKISETIVEKLSADGSHYEEATA